MSQPKSQKKARFKQLSPLLRSLATAPRAVATTGTHRIRILLLSEMDRFVLWCPVLFGLGIGLYFAQTREPAPLDAALVMTLPLTVTLVTYGVCRRSIHAGSENLLGAMIILTAITIAGTGFAAAKARTEWVRSPVIDARHTYPLTVTAYVLDIEREPGAGQRVVFAPNTIRNPSGHPLSASTTPKKIRLHINRKDAKIEPQTWVTLKAMLRPPPQPATPWSYNFPRQAWYARLGAVGYAITAPQQIAPPSGARLPLSVRIEAAIAKLRWQIGGRIITDLPGESGAVATALMTGQRRQISEASLEALRISGLAHILAISGLHMALAGGLFYAATRRLLSAVPYICLHTSTKKWAAIAGITASSVYLLLSGASPATQRAFIMTVLVFLAIIFDRPAITLRTLALAALVILVLSPENLVNISFQMSFAALIALVAFYEYIRTARRARDKRRSTNTAPATHSTNTPSSTGPPHSGHRFHSKLIIYTAGLAATTIVAEIATGLIAGYHFNHFGIYGLIANLLAMPVITFVVMPCIVVTYLLLPFGAETLILGPLAYAIDLVLAIAHTVSTWPFAEITFAQMPSPALLWLVAGALWLCLWQKPWRLAGLAAIPVAIGLSATQTTPNIFIQREGQNLGVTFDHTPLQILHTRRSKFEQEQWLQIIGAPVPTANQRAAIPQSPDTLTTAALPAPADSSQPRRKPAPPRQLSHRQTYKCDSLGCTVELNGNRRLAYVTDISAFAEDCMHVDIIVSAMAIPSSLRHMCEQNTIVIDRTKLAHHGAHAITATASSFHITTVSETTGDRPWSPPRYTPPDYDLSIFLEDK